MQQFKDSEGRPWLVQVNVALLKQVRAALGIDLYKLLDDGFKGLAGLLGDPVSLVDVLYVLCRAQAAERALTDEQFGQAMGGDALDAATAAFVEALVDFFPDPQVRKNLRTLTRKGKIVHEKVQASVADDLEKIDPQKAADELIAASRLSSGSSPASSASTPAPSPSAS